MHLGNNDTEAHGDDNDKMYEEVRTLAYNMPWNGLLQVHNLTIVGL